MKLHPNEMKLTMKELFIAAEFTAAKILINSDVHQWMTGERTCGLYEYTMGHHSATERINSSFVTKWIPLKIIMLNETSQSTRQKMCFFLTCGNKHKELKKYKQSNSE